MAYTTGRCINDLFCAAASSRQTLQVPVGSQFVCPQCGKALVEPSRETRGGMPLVLLACGGLVLAGALFAAGAMIGGGSAARNVSPEARMTLAEPVRPESRPAPPAVPLSLPPPAPGLAAGAAPATAVLPHPAPAPPTLGREAAPVAAKPPIVQLAMMQVPAGPLPQHQAQVPLRPPLPVQPQAQALAQANTARQARAAEQARRTQLALLAAQQQQKMAEIKATLQAQDFRRRAEQQKAQAEADTLARQQEEASRAAQAQAAAASRLREAQAARKLASLPHGPTRGFSPTAISGGAPAYPADYEADGRSGRVTVSCLISQNGAPSLCHVVASRGGIGFSNAALGWLRGGQVRFAPVLRDGQAEAGEHSWTMDFQP